MDIDELCNEIQSGVNKTIETIKPEAKKFFTLFNSIIENINTQVEEQNLPKIEKLGKVYSYYTTEFNVENYTATIEKILNNENISNDDLTAIIKNIRKNIDILKLLESVCIEEKNIIS